MSRIPQPPLDQLVDDLYYRKGTPPYSRLKLPPMPSAVLILNLGDRFLIGHSGARPVKFADGCLLTTGTRHIEFAYPAFTRSVGVHFKLPVREGRGRRRRGGRLGRSGVPRGR